MGDRRKEAAGVTTRTGRGRPPSCRRCTRKRKMDEYRPRHNQETNGKKADTVEMMAKTVRYNPCNPMGYLLDRQINDRIDQCKRLVEARFENAQNLFRMDLYSHYGCVNAIEFSQEGDLLVSGGDDKRVLLWNVEKAVHEHGEPTVMKAQHMSNIFCLGYNSSKTRIFSAGNDDQVIVHDIQTTDVLNFFRHEKPVYGLSVHPFNDNIFASACDDGRVLIYDMRRSITSPESFLCLARHKNPFHSVMFNPVAPVTLATANAKEGVSMWDLRKPLQPVLRYGSEGPVQSCMHARFNKAGTTLLAIRRRLPPVLYAVNSPQHLCQFDHPGYYNSCTMKSCCFAGNDDEYILSGSDDFNLYMWKIPTDDSVKWVDSAHMILRGHRSIVNQVRYNPASCLIASSGVEKIIKLWSPFPLSENCSGGLRRDDDKEQKQRRVYTHDEYIGLVITSGQVMTHDYSHQSTDEDQRMMAFFDSLVQREIESWSSEDAPSPQSPSEPENNNASDHNASDSEDSTASDQQLMNCTLSSSPQSPASSSTGERPLESPNRITRLIAYRREKLMRLAHEGGSPSKSDSTTNTNATNTKPTTRATPATTSNNGEESASATEPETSATTRSKSKKNKVAQKLKGVKRKHNTRAPAKKNGVRKKQNDAKGDSDSEPEEQPAQRQTRTDKNNYQAVDGAQPSTSTGVVSSSRRSRYTSTPPTTTKPRLRQSRSSSYSSSEDRSRNPMNNRNASKRRVTKSDSDSSATEQQQSRKSTRNKNKASTSSVASNTRRDGRGKSKRQKVGNDVECNSHSKKELANGGTKETSMTPEKNAKNAATSDSGITSGVSTTEKSNTTAEKTTGGRTTRAESSDRERIIKNLEWFRKKVETARRGYRKRAMLPSPGNSDSSDE